MYVYSTHHTSTTLWEANVDDPTLPPSWETSLAEVMYGGAGEIINYSTATTITTTVLAVASPPPLGPASAAPRPWPLSRHDQSQLLDIVLNTRPACCCSMCSIFLYCKYIVSTTHICLYKYVLIIIGEHMICSFCFCCISRFYFGKK